VKTNRSTLNKLSILILELKTLILSLEAEFDSLNASYKPWEDLNEVECEAILEYRRELSDELDKNRGLFLAALDEWNEKCIRFFHP